MNEMKLAVHQAAPLTVKTTIGIWMVLLFLVRRRRGGRRRVTVRGRGAVRTRTMVCSISDFAVNFVESVLVS